ncbi:hypothetical protein HPB49_002404 [Dermacentor silvarum]|uniref:Uncharacterized protein n=1 Tax=Dermacentor silvarum TaxID=543639 RepID=A0ACB8DI99_DERSI|nr:hypothetical protein HPB49_002404 [Dermacentor silvarum]
MDVAQQEALAADAHQLSSGSSQEETMDLHEVQDVPIPEEDDENISSPWIEVTRRANHCSPPPPSHSTLTLDPTLPKPALRRGPGPRQPKQPPLPMEKMIVGGNTYEVAVSPIAPDNSCKGVIYNIGTDCSVEEVRSVVEAPGYEFLIIRHLGSSSTLAITFKGKRVTFYIYVHRMLTRCYLYKRRAAYMYNLSRDQPSRRRLPEPPDNSEVQELWCDSLRRATRVPPIMRIVWRCSYHCHQAVPEMVSSASVSGKACCPTVTAAGPALQVPFAGCAG